MESKRFYTISISDGRLTEKQTIIADKNFMGVLEKLVKRAKHRSRVLTFFISIISVLQQP